MFLDTAVMYHTLEHTGLSSTIVVGSQTAKTSEDQPLVCYQIGMVGVALVESFIAINPLLDPACFFRRSGVLEIDALWPMR